MDDVAFKVVTNRLDADVCHLTSAWTLASAYAREEMTLVRLALIRVRSLIGVAREQVGSQVMR